MTASAMANNFPGGLLARSIEQSVLAGGRACCWLSRGGAHSDLDVVGSVLGGLHEPEPVVKRLGAVVDHENVEHHRKARLCGLVEEVLHDSAADSLALVAGLDFDAGQVRV